MNINFRKLLLIGLLTGFLGGLTACNTIEGAGRDVEKAGEEIQDAADDNR